MSLSPKALVAMGLLALQFGIQPALTRRFTNPELPRSAVILVQEVFKVVLAASLCRKAPAHWSIRSWLQVAVVPAGLYAVQNWCSLTAYQTLDGLTYNVLNQTKTLSAAFFCYLLLGRRQSPIQIFALLLLLLAALIMEDMFVGGTISFAVHEPHHWTHGVVPVLTASLLSGLAGAWSQKNLQDRDPYFFSLELSVASLCLLSLSLLVSPDGQVLREQGHRGWTWSTLIPIGTNAVGGILVGLVTKYAGSVRKGFALILGIGLSGALSDQVTRAQVMGGALAGLSLYLHAVYPPKTKKAKVE